LSALPEQYVEKTWAAFFAGPACPDFTIDRNNELLKVWKISSLFQLLNH
jgi:hypothetical protein